MIVKMTPELAKQYLEMNTDNRPMSYYHEVYAEDMKEGRWKENGEAIIIDRNGVVKDGQNRLKATIVADHEWFVPVVSDVEPDVMDTIDTGKARSLGDIVKMDEMCNHTHIAAIARVMIRWDAGILRKSDGTSKKPITNNLGISYIRQNKERIIDLHKLSAGIYKKQIAKIYPVSDIALIIYIISHGKAMDSPTVVNFVKLLTGYTTDENSGVTWLYRKMAKYKQSKESVKRKWWIGVAINCWNLYIDGNPPVNFMRFDVGKPLPKVSKLMVGFA